jgi:hypothetical protein
MSFGAGLSAGMGAGIGAGIAIGVSSGEKRVVQRIRDHMAAHELTIHDRMGKDVDLETVLDNAVRAGRCTKGGWGVVLLIALVGGVALLSLLTVLVWRMM